MAIDLLLIAGPTFVLSLLLTAAARPISRRIGWVDRPNLKRGGQLQDRREEVPLLGGSAVVVTLLVGLAFALLAAPALFDTSGSRLFAAIEANRDVLGRLLWGSLALHGLGLLDDRLDLGPGLKLVLQFSAASYLVAALDLRLLSTWLPPLASVLLSLVWIVGVINAFNFLDGMDGLMSSVACVCCGLFVLTALANGDSMAVFILVLLLGSLAGYLVFNAPPASIFLGDAGSLVVGFWIAYASMSIVYHEAGSDRTPWYALLTPVVILAIPLYDVVSVTLLRLRSGDSPFAGDDRHLSNRLRRLGLGARGTVAVMSFLTLLSGLGGVLLAQIPGWQAAVVLLHFGLVLASLSFMEAVLAKVRHRSPAEAFPPRFDAELPLEQRQNG